MKTVENKAAVRLSEPFPNFIKDRFSRARGGTSELWSLSCAQCQSEVFRYQKDGHGNLLRCYVDRIYLPSDYTHPLNSATFSNKKEMPVLTCPSCQTTIGFPTVFKPEKRLAYSIIKGTLAKKKLK